MTDYIDTAGCAAEWHHRYGRHCYAPKWKYYTGEPPPPQRWLIKNILPEVGVGLAAGQWGLFKTTAALDLSLSAMSGIDFANHFRVKRMGGVVYFAPEGSGGIDNRLYTLHSSVVSRANCRLFSHRVSGAYRQECRRHHLPLDS